MRKVSSSKAIAIPAIFAVLGLVMVLLSIGAATIWKPASTIDARVQAPENTVVTRPGVLSLVNQKVKIEATAPKNGEVIIVVGRSADAIGWAASQPWTEITGIKDSQELTYIKHGASGSGKGAQQAENANTESPLSSNMWVATAKGQGKAELSWNQTDGQYSALIFSTTGKPTVSLQWHKESQSAYFVPLLTIGIILLLLAAVTWLIMYLSAQRQTAPQEPVIEEEEQEPATVILMGEDVAPSRRALREARERGEAAIIVGDKEFPTGLIPVVDKVNVAANAAATKDSEAAAVDAAADAPVEETIVVTAAVENAPEDEEAATQASAESTEISDSEADDSEAGDTASDASEVASRSAAAASVAPQPEAAKTVSDAGKADRSELERIAASAISLGASTAQTRDPQPQEVTPAVPTVEYEEANLDLWNDLGDVTNAGADVPTQAEVDVEVPVVDINPGLRSYDDDVTLADFEMEWSDGTGSQKDTVNPAPATETGEQQKEEK